MKRATLKMVFVGIAAKISIHALVKRATGDIVPRSKGDFISIHALVKRATSVSPVY